MHLVIEVRVILKYACKGYSYNKLSMAAVRFGKNKAELISIRNVMLKKYIAQ